MKYSLALDIGNTWIKAAVFDSNGIIVHHFQYKSFSNEFYKELNNPQYAADQIIVSNVRQAEPAYFNINAAQKIILNADIPVPFNNLYSTPKTLGMDRVAAISGAMLDYPDQPVLIITAGTCLTYNLLTEDNQFLGGAISPGLTMRYRALSKFTGKLPMVRHAEFDNLIGMDTEESIKSGVQNGLLAEVDEIINKYQTLYPNIVTVMTGGATVFFENKLKNKIFADPLLIFKGLYHILQFNAK